ncbi:hypothetical protein AK812_SmicGene23037 [Symbiodinium microadriaticum]|uniref:Uncharacterized protein n=1 Tax=Symbiodinium microadriaticum TaxID=2951 RepID=A0A1Q9DIA1_SYMMI|nr:hypothetical protein AK812_SmicGene23037 [Symbiodinium microadriaticum]
MQLLRAPLAERASDAPRTASLRTNGTNQGKTHGFRRYIAIACDLTLDEERTMSDSGPGWEKLFSVHPEAFKPPLVDVGWGSHTVGVIFVSEPSTAEKQKDADALRAARLARFSCPPESAATCMRLYSYKLCGWLVNTGGASQFGSLVGVVPDALEAAKPLIGTMVPERFPQDAGSIARELRSLTSACRVLRVAECCASIF